MIQRKKEIEKARHTDTDFTTGFGCRLSVVQRVYWLSRLHFRNWIIIYYFSLKMRIVVCQIKLKLVKFLKNYKYLNCLYRLVSS